MSRNRRREKDRLSREKELVSTCVDASRGGGLDIVAFSYRGGAILGDRL